MFKRRDESRSDLHNERLKRPEIFRSTQRQAKARFRINLKPLKPFVYLAIAGLIVYAVFISDLFKIKSVEVEGVKSIEISDYIKTNLVGKNILMLRTGRFLADLNSKYPILEEASIVRGLPNTVQVTVLERKQSFVWCNIEKCWFVDNNGYAYQQIPRPSDAVVLNDTSNMTVKEADKVASRQFISFFLSATEAIDKTGVKVTEAKIEDTTFKLIFKTTEGWEIIMDSSASLKTQISALQQALDKNRTDIKQYVDVRVDGSAYIK